MHSLPLQIWYYRNDTYRQTSNISCTLIDNKIVDHSDIIGASPVGAAPTTYIFILDLTPGFNGMGKDNCKMRRQTFKFLGFGVTYTRGLTVYPLYRKQPSKWPMHINYIHFIEEGKYSGHRQVIISHILWLNAIAYPCLKCLLVAYKSLYRPITHIPQCIKQISQNASFCNRNVHTCTFLLQNSALWDIGLVHCGICETALLGHHWITSHDLN